VAVTERYAAVLAQRREAAEGGGTSDGADEETESQVIKGDHYE